MKPYLLGTAVGALTILAFAPIAEAAPAGLTRSATAASEKSALVEQVGRRHWRRRHYHHRHHRHYRPRFGFYYGSPYYGWVPPRRYYRPHYRHRYYGYGPSVYFLW